MRRMPIADTTTVQLSGSALKVLGLRAIWLHMLLSGPAAGALAPRDREILTLVATRPGITLAELTDLLRLNGSPRPSVRFRVLSLVSEGFIDATRDDRRAATDDDPTEVVIDLTRADLHWIAEQTTADQEAARS